MPLEQTTATCTFRICSLRPSRRTSAAPKCTARKPISSSGTLLPTLSASTCAARWHLAYISL